ncbi:hypothetical protein ACQUSY_10240 [Microbacterium sp. YY-03]|uniref:hypothetical protein n=1 Tax=Microbacterium sp. YY-03 TaxID=3421636 RepID=UPI003D1638C9
MLTVARTMGAVLWRRGPELMAAYLAGAAAHFLLIRLAGLVTAASEFWGMFVHPLPILARLISYVVMLLIVRDALPSLSAMVPPGSAPRAERRTALINAILMAILPFFAFYYATGYLNEDMRSIIQVSATIQRDWTLTSALAGGTETAFERAELDINVLIVVIAVAAFALRALAKRFEKTLPAWTRLASVYLEVVWVFLSVRVIRELVNGASAWLEDRTAFAWLFGIGDWFAATLPPVAAVWEAFVAVIGAVAGLIGAPLAWLTVAGVVYGQAVAARPLAAQVSALTRVKSRYGRVNQTVREGVTFAVDKVAGDTKGRLATIGKALSMALRAGPLVLGGYVLLYQLWVLGAAWLDVGLLRMLGPLSPDVMYWVTAITWPLALAISEPLRSALVSAAYDTVLTTTVNDNVAQAEEEAAKAEAAQSPSET